jgi:hypothetical protein
MKEEKLPGRGLRVVTTDNYRNHGRKKMTSSRISTSSLGGETTREH